MASMTEAETAAFLATPRFGVLSTLRRDGSPVALPVWFEWDGASAQIFTGDSTPKVARLRRDPRASLLVTNAVGEPEAWVAFDGEVAIKRGDAIALAERLAARYWQEMSEARRAELDSWRRAAAHLVILELTPRTIRSSKG